MNCKRADVFFKHNGKVEKSLLYEFIGVAQLVSLH